MSDAILPRPRRVTYADLDAQHQLVKYLERLAVSFYDVDVRPLIWDGTSVQRLGPDPVPSQLRDAIRTEGETLHRLEAEYLREHAPAR